MFMVNVAWSRTTRTHVQTHSVSRRPWHLFLRWQSAYILNCPQPPSHQPAPHPCLSVQLSVIIQAEMDVRGPLHISMSLFLFSFPPPPSLRSRSPLNSESQAYKNAQLFMMETEEEKKRGRGR